VPDLKDHGADDFTTLFVLGLFSTNLRFEFGIGDGWNCCYSTISRWGLIWRNLWRGLGRCNCYACI